MKIFWEDGRAQILDLISGPVSSMEEHKTKADMPGRVHLRSQVLLRSRGKKAREGYTLSSKGRTKELMAGKTIFFFKPGAKM